MRRLTWRTPVYYYWRAPRFLRRDDLPDVNVMIEFLGIPADKVVAFEYIPRRVALRRGLELIRAAVRPDRVRT